MRLQTDSFLSASWVHDVIEGQVEGLGGLVETYTLSAVGVTVSAESVRLGGKYL